MRKLEDRENQFAEMGRLNKAVKLSAVIRANYGPITQEVVNALPTQSHEWWASLSKAAEVNPPSPATVEAVVGMLAQDIQLRYDADPLEGLPTP